MLVESFSGKTDREQAAPHEADSIFPGSRAMKRNA